MNRLIQTRKRTRVEALVVTKHVKNINEVRGVHTLPEGGWLFVCSGNKVGLVNTLYGWNKQDVAGNFMSYTGRQDGKALNATFDCPHAVIQDMDGNIVVADTDNHCLRKIDRSGIVSTFSGVGSVWSKTDPHSLVLSSPHGMALMQDGRIAVADTGNNCVRVVDKAGRISTLCGGREAGYKDGGCDDVRFNGPYGIVVMADGNLLVLALNVCACDGAAHTILKL